MKDPMLDLLWALGGAVSILVALILLLSFPSGAEKAEAKGQAYAPEVVVLEATPYIERQEPPVSAEPVDKPAYDPDIPLSEDLQTVLWDACAEFGVDYPLMLALIEHETNFRNLTGDDGHSVGYCQIQERWWRGLMEEIGAEDLLDPRDNFRTGCAIVARLTARYGNVRDALSAYNTGSPGVTIYANAVLAAVEAQ